MVVIVFSSTLVKGKRRMKEETEHERIQRMHKENRENLGWGTIDETLVYSKKNPEMVKKRIARNVYTGEIKVTEYND